MKKIADVLPRGLVVSCQALEDEPLHSDFIMSKLALAAEAGGAVGIRANSHKDILAIKKEVSLPVIGIVKREYAHSEVFITPTLREVAEVHEAGADIVAFDATLRARPDGHTLGEFVQEVKAAYPQLLLMADVSTYEEGLAAAALEVDVVATTLCGYTPQTRGQNLPALDVLEKLVRGLSLPVIAEGGIWTTEDLNAAFERGAYACVMGTAITRVREITRRLVSSIDVDIARA